MKYLSICSGIEAATAAWHHLGWKPAGFSEIEAFPSAVLKHHYPDVPNFGDMTTFKNWNLNGSDISLLVGGTPCQSFSVAGMRKGLSDDRGNLALTFCEMADHFDPEWVLWENVPGVLSSQDNAFGCFLAGLAGEDEPLVAPGGKWTNAGYVLGPKRTVAWRILDAQYFGVAQRRRRVFVVASPRDRFDPREILFESEGLRRDTPPSRETREGVAKCLTRGVGQRYDPETESLIPSYGIPGNWIGRAPENGGNAVEPMHDIAPCLTKTDQHGVAHPIGLDEEQNAMIDAFGTLKARTAAGGFEGTVMQTDMTVRRLTSVECERLQGFPDNYTAIPWRSKVAEDCPDGPRYKALGNSMAVPVMRWIGERINKSYEIDLFN